MLNLTQTISKANLSIYIYNTKQITKQPNTLSDFSRIAFFNSFKAIYLHYQGRALCGMRLFRIPHLGDRDREASRNLDDGVSCLGTSLSCSRDPDDAKARVFADHSGSTHTFGGSSHAAATLRDA